MHRRATRLVVLVLLLGIGVGAGVETWGVTRRLEALDTDHRELSTRIERLQSAITFIAAAQHTYIGSGQPDELSLDRVSVLVQQITNDTATVRTRIRAENSASHLQVFADGLAGLIKADERARQNLAQGQALAAADAVFRESRDHVAAMEAKLRELRYAESALFEAETTRLEARGLRTVGAVAILWTFGLIALAPLATAAHAMAAVATTPAEKTPGEAVQSSTPQIDLPAAADLCTAISRLTDAAALPPLLGRAAAILDAPGLIVWMGAGEELFAATASGYDPATVARLGPIARAADNATAAAWRTGELRSVSGDATASGAIVVPMFGTDGCMGVLAVELRNGRETDAATRAVTSMIAAQLATVLSAWPAASTTALDDSGVEVPGSGSERHAEAS